MQGASPPCQPTRQWSGVKRSEVEWGWHTLRKVHHTYQPRADRSRTRGERRCLHDPTLAYPVQVAASVPRREGPAYILPHALRGAWRRVSRPVRAASAGAQAAQGDPSGQRARQGAASGGKRPAWRLAAEQKTSLSQLIGTIIVTREKP